jgi:hypothetical protein
MYCIYQLNAIRDKELAEGKNEDEIDKTIKEAQENCQQFLD